ncbi:S8 family serine peptidase [Planococcus halotolerans]|uniref:Peptidase S8 n=1 Tax=Planococcus halotolerans TaxID=2233542 RepID=A0A365KRQ9_9BACL|nr:S8 family serine peptidase [Planococcus halotolerans]QHJ69543.1 S8 family serine peptidase [Planococcus halotolerans]RAZ75492.1 peptidase S8 [Planococcus halotolerans]
MQKFLVLFSIFTLAIGLAFNPYSFNQKSSASTEGAIIDPRLQQVLADSLLPVEVIITFEDVEQADSASLQLLEDIGVSNGVVFQNLPFVGSLLTADQVEKVAALEQVQSIYYNAPLQYDNESSTSLTGVDQVREDADFQAANGGLPITGENIGVVINDSGVDGTHKDHELGKNLVQNVMANINLNSTVGLLPIAYLENVPNTDSSSGHGTHVTGTVGGTGAMSGGKYEGVAPGANLIGYGSGAGIAIMDTIGGFDYALTHQTEYNIRVITNSWGDTSDSNTDFDPNHPINIATKKLYERGIITVFSAGNSGPGESTISGNYKKAPWVVTVAAGNSSMELADFSSRGVKDKGGTVVIDGETFTWADRPTVTAPGVDIVSTRVISPLSALSVEKDTSGISPAHLPYYTTFSGTSMAAPHVAGIIALILEVDPTLSPAEVKALLQQSATPMPGYETWEAGAGYVNAYEAITLLKTETVTTSKKNANN